MRVPPRWVRRPVGVAAVLAGLVLAVALSPVLLAVAAASNLVTPGRFRAVRLLGFAVVWLSLECLALLAALVLWPLHAVDRRRGGRRTRRAHYAVLRLVLHTAVTAARVLFGLRIVTDGPSWSPLDDGEPGSTNAMLVLSRHAGAGDSVLLVETLMNRDHLRQPRIVLKDTLRLDPTVDVLLDRLPAAFLTPGRPDLAGVVADTAVGLGEEDALLIFPEGGNFTPHRRLRAIASLRGRGMHAQAEHAELMRHVLPPRTSGVLAALDAAPHADVVFVAHTGLEHLSTVSDVWRGLPMDADVLMHWWFVPADEVPPGNARAQWVYERWAEIDRWVGEHRPASGVPA